MRLLLTQSQVSVALSSGVVVFFTLLLFLSGYVLQQKTVKGLQDAVRPRIPQRPPGSEAQEPEIVELSRSRLFGGNGGERIVRTDFDREVHSSAAGHRLDWNRLAHIQLVRNHHDMCSAIMILAELHKQKSPARRLLLFPKAWAEQKKAEKGETEDPYVQSTRRLMRLAARRYHVELHPIAPIRTVKNKDGEDVETYSLVSAYALQNDFDRLLTIETPGMLLDAEPLDAILGFTEAAPFVMLHDTVKNDNVHSEDMFLLQPSKTLYNTLTKTLEEEAYSGFNDTYLASLFPEPVLLASSSESSALIRSVGTLHHAGHDFNQTAYLDNVAYIRFSDPKLPGPEYDVPWADKVAARPKNKDADWTWTKLYGEFAQMRMEICGLDLDSWRPQTNEERLVYGL